MMGQDNAAICSDEQVAALLCWEMGEWVGAINVMI